MGSVWILDSDWPEGVRLNPSNAQEVPVGLIASVVNEWASAAEIAVIRVLG